MSKIMLVAIDGNTTVDKICTKKEEIQNISLEKLLDKREERYVILVSQRVSDFLEKHGKNG